MRLTHMAGKPQHHAEMIETRARRADGGEPLNDERRQVQRVGNSIMIGLTDYGVQTHNLSTTDTLRVAVYPDGIWIDTSGGANE